MSKKLEPVPMKTFWKCVSVQIKAKTGREIDNLHYIAAVHRGTMYNKTLSPVIAECVKTVVSDLKNRGQCPRYPV